MSSQTTITPEDLLAHSAWLQRLAARLVEPSSAEDLVQETWATAVRVQPDRDRPLRPWLAEVLRNLARMRARGASRWSRRAEQVRASDDVALPSPEELLTYHEAQRLVAEEVSRLEEPYRSTVLLCYGQGMEPAEIARRQDIPPGTVRWRLKRGLDEVRSKMDARYGNDRRAWTLLLAPLAARTVVRGVAGATVLGVRAFTLKAAVVAVAVAGLGVAVLRWFDGQRTAARPALVELQEPAPMRVTGAARVPRLLAAAPTPGGPPPGRPGGAAAGLPAAVPAGNEPGQIDLVEARRRAAELGDSPVRGNPKAAVTIVMYTEFQCPFCSRVVLTLGELQALYPQDVRLVFKHLPLPFHESAGLASEAALAAAEQGKFWQMHDRLFANQDKLDPMSLVEHAKAIGADVGQFKAALDSGKFRKRIEADLQLAKDAKISGTPTFLINGEMFMGAQPLESFKQKVEEALAKAKGLPAPKPAVVAQPPMPKPGAPRPQVGFFWPPPKVVLPDNLLGERLGVPVVTGNAPMRGKGPVEVLYFTTVFGRDCQRGRDVLQGILDTYGEHVRVIAKVLAERTAATDDRPLAAEAAMAAHKAGKFWEFHDRAAERPGFEPAAQEVLEQVAEKVGMDVGELRAALASGRYRTAIREESDLFRRAGIDQVAFAVNGRVAEGNVALVQLIETAIKKAGKKPPAWPAGPNLPPMLGMHMSPRQVFATEPRDEAWAAPIEKELAPLIEKDLRTAEPKLADVGLDCKSSLCRLHWRPGKGDPKVIGGLIRFIYALPGTIPPLGGRALPNEHYLNLRGRIGPEPGQTAESAINRVKSRRGTVLYNVRTGRAKLPPILPGERMPKE